MPALAPEPESSPIQTSDLSAITNPRPSRSKGKIAALPTDQRRLINQLLDHGVTYKVIAAEMAKLGVTLNGENLSNWFNSGYQEHVRNREWRDELRSLRESAADLADPDDTAQFQQSILQLGLMEIFRALNFGQLQPDSPNFFRLFSALTRLSHEALALRKYTDAHANEQARHHNYADSSSDLQSEVLERILEPGPGIKPDPNSSSPDLSQPLDAPKAEVAGESLPPVSTAPEPDEDQSTATPPSPTAAPSVPVALEDCRSLKPKPSNSNSTDFLTAPVNEPSGTDSTTPLQPQ